MSKTWVQKLFSNLSKRKNAPNDDEQRDHPKPPFDPIPFIKPSWSEEELQGVLQHLPKDIQMYILSTCLPLIDLASMAQLNSYWNNLCMNQSLWKYLLHSSDIFYITNSADSEIADYREAYKQHYFAKRIAWNEEQCSMAIKIEGDTVINRHGAWNNVLLGKSLTQQKYQVVHVKIDSPVIAMMLVAYSKFPADNSFKSLTLYPGSGNVGLSHNRDKTNVAFYSSGQSHFRQGDVITIEVLANTSSTNKTIRFYCDGALKGSIEMDWPDGYVLGASLCGTEQKLTLLRDHSITLAP